MLTVPTQFAEHAGRIGSRRHYILSMVDSGVTYLFSDCEMHLTDGHVYNVGLQIGELSSACDFMQGGSTVSEASVAFANIELYIDTSNVRVRPSDVMGALTAGTAKIYLAAGSSIASLSDCLQVYSGKMVGELAYNKEQSSLSIADDGFADQKKLPQTDISASFTGAVSAIHSRKQPLVYGTFVRDDYLAGGLAVAEEIENDKFLIAGHALKSAKKIWLYHDALGDFVEVIPWSTTLTANISAAATLLPVSSYLNMWKKNEFIRINPGGGTEEMRQIQKTGNSSVYVTAGVTSAHNSTEKVERWPFNVDESGKGVCWLLRDKVQFDTTDSKDAYAIGEAIRCYAYIHPDELSQSAIYNKSDLRRTYITVTANSGQAVVAVNDTTGFVAGDTVTLDPEGVGGGTEDKTILSIDSLTQLTMTANLTFTHTLAQGDPIVPKFATQAMNVSSWAQCTDQRGDTYASVKSGHESASTGYGNLNVGFPDLGSGRGNIANEIGFIEDYDLQINWVAAPAVTLSVTQATLQTGATRKESAQTRKATKSFTATGALETINYAVNELPLRLFTELAKSTFAQTYNSTDLPSSTIKITDGTGFSPGMAIILEPDELISREDGRNIVAITAMAAGSTTFSLDRPFNLTHASGDAIESAESVATLWGFKTGDSNSGIGLQLGLHVETTTAGKTAVGTEIARVYETRLRIKALIPPRGTQNLIFWQTFSPSMRRHESRGVKPIRDVGFHPPRRTRPTLPNLPGTRRNG